MVKSNSFTFPGGKGHRFSVRCRFCNSSDVADILDLGVQPPSNSFVTADHQLEMEPHYPLIVFHCGECGLIQVPEVAPATSIFSDYLYFSSYSEDWVEHARRYVDMAVERFRLDDTSRVVELASNDGYLLQFVTAKGIPALGIEPAANVAEVARAKRVNTLSEFFTLALGQQLAAQGQQADLIIGNNVLAHVPNLNDFVAGLTALVKPNGVITMEFPHLVKLVEEMQFDTVYHEHFSYFSLFVAKKIFARHGLRIFDVDTLPTHGGSLRIYACRAEADHPECPVVNTIEAEERAAGYGNRDKYTAFGQTVYRFKRELLAFLMKEKSEGRSIAAYGAAAKGNTMLNFLGVRSDIIDFVVDRNPQKQGRYLPGSRIQVRAPEDIKTARPDLLLILPWNLKSEIERQTAYIRDWGGRFVTLIPRISVF